MATYNGHNEDASGNILLSIGNGMTATLETGTTASQAYTKGAYLYYNNRLCKVTAAIASGNTLTIGTNIAYTSLGAELTSHLKATNGDEFYFDYKDGEPGYYPSASKTASQFVPIGGTAQKGSGGTLTLSTTTTTHIELGFKPSYLILTTQKGPFEIVMVYVAALSTTKYWYHSNNVSGSTYSFNPSGTNGLASIDDDGFTVAKMSASAYATAWYAAVE